MTALQWRTAIDPLDEHPWVLVTGSEASAIDAIRSACSVRGWETYVCAGPCEGHSCPLVDGGACPVVADARMVVIAHDRSAPRATDFLAALDDRYPDVPVVAFEDLSG
jgi:hypothetical protein